MIIVYMFIICTEIAGRKKVNRFVSKIMHPSLVNTSSATYNSFLILASLMFYFHRVKATFVVDIFYASRCSCKLFKHNSLDFVLVQY